MRTYVDQEQNFRAGLRMALLRKDNPAIVSGGARVKSSQLSAQVVCLQAGVVKIFRHPPQGSCSAMAISRRHRLSSAAHRGD